MSCFGGVLTATLHILDWRTLEDVIGRKVVTVASYSHAGVRLGGRVTGDMADCQESKSKDRSELHIG